MIIFFFRIVTNYLFMLFTGITPSQRMLQPDNCNCNIRTTLLLLTEVFGWHYEGHSRAVALSHRHPTSRQKNGGIKDFFHKQTTSNIAFQIDMDQADIDAEIVMFELYNKN
jgi:hypothetical protein